MHEKGAVRAMVEAAGVELFDPIDNTQVIDSISRLNRQNRQNCQSEVHGRYTAHTGRFSFGGDVTPTDQAVDKRLEFTRNVGIRLAVARYNQPQFLRQLSGNKENEQLNVVSTTCRSADDTYDHRKR